MDGLPQCGICSNHNLGTAAKAMYSLCDLCGSKIDAVDFSAFWSGSGYMRLCPSCSAKADSGDCCVCGEQPRSLALRRLTVVVGGCRRSVRFACSSAHLEQAEMTLRSSLRRSRGYCSRCDVVYSECPEPGDIVELEIQESLPASASWLGWRYALYLLGLGPPDYVWTRRYPVR